VRGRGPYLDCRAHLHDLSARDRALMLEFRLPFSSEQAWTWHGGQYERRQVQPGRRHHVLSSRVTPSGQPKASVYPFAVLSGRDASLCLAVPLFKEPRLFRLFAYRPFIGGPVLAVEFDVGLSAATKHFPSRASYRFVIYSTEPTWAFRRAVERYYEFFPEQFTSVAKRHGNWAVLGFRLDIPNLADFAVAANETAFGCPPHHVHRYLFDHVLGIPSCPYRRPGTWSQEFDGAPGDKDAYEKRMALLAEQEKMPEHAHMLPHGWSYWGSPLPLMVRATRNSALRDREGRDIWGYNVVRGEHFFSRNSQYLSHEVPSPNWAQVITRQCALAYQWAEEAGAPLDGIYFDNMGGYSINAFDFRRDHWALARFPLVVNADPPGPTQSKALQLCEFFPRMAEDVHRRGGFLIGNFGGAEPFAIGQHFDFIGVEGYKGALIERLRVMAGPKPASYLPTAPVTRDMFENCLSYGVGPGFRMSARALYREFMPLIVPLSQAGWQPVPHARYSVEGAMVERFGSFGAGDLSFTVRHLTQGAEHGVLRVDAQEAGIPDRDLIVVDVRRNETVEHRWEGDRLIIPLPTRPGRTEVVRVCRAPAWTRERTRRLADALERAGREWAWVKAQHDDSLAMRLGFEDDNGRWLRNGFEGAKVGLSTDAHSGRSALMIEARSAVKGRIRTAPFVIRRDTGYLVTFHYRAEGKGQAKAKAVSVPSYRMRACDTVRETPLPDVALSSAWRDGWRRLEAELKPPHKGRSVYLQLDFSSFAGRFSIDSLSVSPRFEPLPHIPRFGFTVLCGKLRSALRARRQDRIEALTRDAETRLVAWQAAARGLPPGDADRMAHEIAVIKASLDLCRKRF